MNCEQAILQIAAQVDQEIAPDDRATLQQHLTSCPTCTAVAEAFHLQDIDLRRGFAPLCIQADAAGDKVIAEVRATPAPAPVATTPAPAAATRRPWLGFVPLALASAALFAVVYSLYKAPPPRIDNPLAPKVDLVSAPPGAGYLAPKARAEVRAPERFAVGAALTTKAGERRRLALPDGSILYVNEGSSLKLDSDRRVTLTAGEIYVEVEPKPDFPFIVESGNREVRALGTRFSVRAERNGPAIVVTQGTVQVSGLASLVHAGQQLAPGGSDVSAAPRASHLLDWTRELLAAAESPLVPKSAHCGGSLIALDPNGQEAKLSLRKVHVDVHIEDGFARTTIDQTYFNHLSQRLEGTFYFPLPPDGSLSRLAMYVVDGNHCTLNEGGMCERNYARQVFEQIVSRMQDPALLEWIDGSTFKMRVFPLEGRQEKRIIMSYTQKLDSLYGATSYRFPAGHNMNNVGQWSLEIRAKGAAKQTWKSATHQLKQRIDGDDLILEDRADDVKLDKDVHVSIADAPNRPATRFSTAEHEGAKYLMLRYRPDLSGAQARAEKERTDWVFLFESGGDRDPLVARTQIDVIRTFLFNANHDDTFTILTAATRVGKVVERRPATAENIKAALEKLEKVHLVGALDLGQAIAALGPFLKDAKNPQVVHVGSGIAALGERAEDVLVKRLSEDVPYVGVGVGKRWSRNYMKLAAERTGGAFTQINPDEEIGWRAFELFSTLRTPRLLGIKVVDNAERAKFLSHTGAIAHGEEICAIARVDKGAELPKSVSVSGTLNGKPFAQELPVKDVADKAGVLPRTWAKLEIDRLLADNAEGNKPRIIELSKQMYVMTPFTSLLVLENEAMYQQYNVDRGRKDHWAMYPCPPHIPIVHEPDPRHTPVVRIQPNANEPNQKLTAEQVMQTILVRMPPRFFQDRYGRHHGHVMTAWQLAYAAEQERIQNLLKDLNVSIRDQKFNNKPGWDVDGPMNDSTIASNGGLGRVDRLARFNTSGWGRLPSDLPMFKEKQGDLAFDASLGQHPDGRMPPRPGNPGRPMRGELPDLASFAIRDFKKKLPPPPGFFTQSELRLEELAEMREGEFGQIWRGAGKGDSKSGEGGAGKSSAGRRRQFGWGQDFDGMPGLQAVDHYVSQIFNGQDRQALVYQRPTFTGDERFFTDLVSYAPGMNTRQADILAVLDAETQPAAAQASGSIDLAARELIDRARGAGWKKMTFPGKDGTTITFDGTGRHRYERELPVGLREQVVCDGTTLWHLYAELGVGGKRTVSRFHRADFSAMIPFVVPPADDLARSADVKHVAERTIRIIPLGSETAKDKDGKPVPYAAVQYVFAADGRLAEYSVVQLPENKTTYRETYDADGTIRRFDREGKERSVVKVTLAAADAPELKPTTDGLVVLPLPARERSHLWRQTKARLDRYKELDEETALALVASSLASHNGGEMARVFAERFQCDMKSIGIYTLLTATGVDVQNLPTPPQSVLTKYSVLMKHGDEPLGRYLAYISDSSRRQGVHGHFGFKPGSFLGRLTSFRDLWIALRNGPHGDARVRLLQFAEALDFVKANPASPFAWVMVETIINRGYGHEAARAGLADGLAQLKDTSGLSYYVKYEIARAAMNDPAGGARKQFAELYRQAFKDGALPPFDHSLYQSLAGQATKDGQNQWQELMRETAAALMKDKHGAAVIGLAWQVQQVGDATLADELRERVLLNATAEERLPVTLAILENHWQNGQFARADALLTPILDEGKYADSPTLWRLAAALAQRQQKLLRAVTCLDKALELEYHQLPEIINLETVRQDFGMLLHAYATVAQAYRSLETPAPADFTAKVVRLADRWRTLDPDPTQACQAVGVVLRAAGQKELAWDYLTTPLALRPNEGATYRSLAQNLQAQQEIDLADKAYALACATEPTNAQLFWERAQMLQQAGKTAAARQVYQQIADGKWEQRHQWLQHQARQLLGQQAGR